jgi:hypothetical protein
MNTAVASVEFNQSVSRDVGKELEETGNGLPARVRR